MIIGQDILPTPERQSAFREKIGREAVIEQTLVMSAGGTAPLATEGHKITFPRERITVVSSEARSSFTKDFPGGAADLDELAHMASVAIHEAAGSNGAVWPFGFNASIVYSQTTDATATAYLAHRLINRQMFDVAGTHISEAPVISIIGHSVECPQWNLRLEPRFNDLTTSKVFMALNHHFDNADLPISADAIAKHLHGVMDHVHQLIEVMDATG